MTFVDRDEIQLAFSDSGTGRCIVMGHSFLCDREMWAHQAKELARSYRVVNIDLRGHGRSGPAEDPFTSEDLVDDVATVLDHLGIESAIWCGLSIGGMTAMRAALVAPDRVDGLIVVDSSAGQDSWLIRTKYKAMAQIASVVGMRRMMPAVLPIMFGRTTLQQQPDMVAEWGERMASMHFPSMRSSLRYLTSRDSMLPRLGEVRVPTLVMVGEEDRGQPPSRSRAIADAIPGAELIIVPEAGHLSALEQPEVVTEAIRDFLFQSLPPLDPDLPGVGSGGEEE